MRRLPLPTILPTTATLALAAAIAPALVLLPTLSRPAPAPRPVPPHVVVLPLQGVDAGAFASLGRPAVPGLGRNLAAARLFGTAPAVLTAPLTGTGPFDLVAVSWAAPVPGATVRVRVRQNGDWTGWQQIDEDDDGPDRPPAGRPGATAPLLTAGADGVQVLIDTPTGAAPAGLAVDLVAGGSAPADTASGAGSVAASAAAATTEPTIVTRQEWGADERLVTGTPVVDPTVRALFVHHTATTSTYTPAQAFAQIRAIYAFHTQVRGWSDIGYNFLVDRFGRVFEGRRGSIDAAILGAHTGGFNSESLGVAVLGTYTDAPVSPAATDALTDVLAWKAAQYGINPIANVRLTSAGGPYTAHPAGERVKIAGISAHRDVGATECPGDALYAQMAALRRAVAARMTPGLVAPALSAPSAVWNGAPVTVSATIPTTQTWTLTVTPACGTAPVRVLTGRSTGRLAAPWDLRDATGLPVPPGLYRLALATRSPVGAAPTWTTDLEVLPVSGGATGTCPVRRVAAGDGDAPATRALAVGRAVAPDAGTVVLVGTPAAATDGVVAAPLAHALGGPLLLTDPRGLPADVADELRRRRAGRVVVVGGPGAVGPGVIAQLQALGVARVDRVAGATFAGTAAAVATALGAVPGPGGRPARASGVLLAATRGGSLADVATIGAVGAATGRPVLLVTARGVPAETATVLRALRIGRATVVASPADVGDRALRGLAGLGVRSWSRVVGTGRAGVALALARTLPPDGPGARGDAWAGTPAGAGLPDVVAAGAAGRPVLLLPAVVTSGIRAWFGVAHPARTWVLGGSSQVSPALFAALSAVA
ncbi:MAG TPA: peptidoglycan recognition protein [Kineosporiaceae bacterium]|nr:peptidoglycan recognition protein [Kineosporiaceae bacterium]